MIYSKLVLALALSAGLFDGALAQNFRDGGGQGGQDGQQGGGAANSSVAQASGGAAATTAAAAATSAAATAAASGVGDASSQDLQLDPANVQTGSQSDGQANAEAGQSPSDTYVNRLLIVKSSN